MRIYFAPLEGITDGIYRRLHFEYFPGLDRYFIPFVTPTQHRCFTPKEKAAIAPETNRGMPAVPQILAKDAALFLWAAQEMAALGYEEVNLNIGCPAATVVTKGRGAGMLKDQAALQRFLDEIFAHSPLPISVKTRLGFDSLDQWPSLLALLAQYPMKELILHPRLRNEFYEGVPHQDAFSQALAHLACPLVGNGDLFTPEAGGALLSAQPTLSALMLGRGLLANPALGREMKGGPGLQKEELRAFHDALYQAYLTRYDPTTVLFRMKALMHYMLCCFENPEKPRKALRKVHTEGGYQQLAEQLFSNHALLPRPAFFPL